MFRTVGQLYKVFAYFNFAKILYTYYTYYTYAVTVAMQSVHLVTTRVYCVVKINSTVA